MRLDGLLMRGGWYPSRTPLNSALSKSHLGYDEESDVNAIVPLVCDYTSASYARIATLWQQVRYLDRYAIAGALVECGVWKGGTVATMALAHLKSFSKPTRRIHLFDSFEGLPEPRAMDGDEALLLSGGKKSGAMRSINQYAASAEISRNLLVKELGYPENLLSYHPGWFEKTVPNSGARIGPIALLRLDGDWYESTKICLENLYDAVVPNGVVVVDDYGHFTGCRQAVDEFIAGLTHPIMLNYIDYSARYWIKPDRRA